MFKLLKSNIKSKVNTKSIEFIINFMNLKKNKYKNKKIMHLQKLNN